MPWVAQYIWPLILKSARTMTDMPRGRNKLWDVSCLLVNTHKRETRNVRKIVKKHRTSSRPH